MNGGNLEEEEDELEEKDEVELDPAPVDLFTNRGQGEQEFSWLADVMHGGRDIRGLNHKRVQYGLAPIPTDAELSL